MVIGFMFAVQTAFATPTDGKINLETLNKSDAQVLFQGDMMNQQIIFLDNGQMNGLKAKGWWGRHVTRHFTHLRHRVTREARRWGRTIRHNNNWALSVLGYILHAGRVDHIHQYGN